MKLVFISDTHGDLSLIKQVALREYDADVFLHLGDVEAYPEEISPFVAIKGNCDSSLYHYPLERCISLPSGKTMFLRHIPLTEQEAEEIAKKGFSYFIHGHTHRREDEIRGGIHHLCPGSLSKPRDGFYGSYLIMECDERGEKITFKTI